LHIAKKLFVLMILVSIAVPAIPVLAGPEEGGAAARGEYKQTTPKEMELKGSGSVYSNFSFNLSIPANATILSASVDLEGKSITGPLNSVNCNYGDTVNNVAYKGSTDVAAPGNKKPSSFAGETFTNYEYSAVSASDNAYASMNQYNYMQYGFHHFKFKVPLDITTNITATWEGYGNDPFYGGGACTVYFWNNGTTNWESFGSGGASDATFTHTFTGGNYIDEYKCLHILAICTGGMYYRWVYTDYVALQVQGNVLNFPKNPAMDIGGNGRIEWSLTEEKFTYMANVGDVSLMNEIQALVKNSQTQNADIKVKFTSANSGKIRVSNFTVQFNAAPWCIGIPDTFNIDEDTFKLKAIDLNTFFTDDRDTGKLMYEMVYQEDAKKLSADLDIDGHSLNLKTHTNNWWGALKFQIRATDSDGLTRDSNVFKVIVNSVNDAPIITGIPKQIAVEEMPFTMQVRIKDVDMDLNPEETVTFADNSSLFEIEPTTGKIAFTPKQEQVGTYVIMVTATDAAAALDIENFTLEVQDAEDPPTMDMIPDQTATEGQLFSYNVVTTDPDLPYGDVLTFTDNSPLFVIEPATGVISFSPVQKDIGTHKVTVTATDTRGGIASQEFTLNVLNSMGTMNRPPTISAIPNQTAYEDIYFEYQVKADDPDIDTGDSLTYMDNMGAFDINAATGRIAFKPVAKDAGVSTVKITVKDREGLTAFTEFQMTIVKANHAPNVTGISPKAGTKYEPKKVIALQVTARDQDNDRLNYTWKDGENVLGYGANITTSFTDPGTYIITLVVTDGAAQVVNETSIEIVEPGGGGGGHNSGGTNTPGFEGIFVAIAVSVALLVAGTRKKK